MGQGDMHLLFKFRLECSFTILISRLVHTRQKIQKFRWAINLFAHIQPCKSAENQILRQSLAAKVATAAVATTANDRQSRHLVVVALA